MVEKKDTPHINVDYFEGLTPDIQNDVKNDGRSAKSGGVKSVGERIKSLRTEKGVSLEALAESTGFSAEKLAAFESGQAQPPLGTVMKLSSALDAVFAKLLSGEGEKPYAIVRKETLVPFERLISGGGAGGKKKPYTYFSLGAEVKDRHMEPLIVYLEESSEEELSVHDGEEFIHVLEGRVKLIIKNELFELRPGDSVYYQSSLPHLVTAADGRAMILAVLYE